VSLDDDTLRRARDGDADAWRRVIEVHQRAVLARAGSVAAAEATFLAVLAALPKYALGAERFEAWILTMAGTRAEAATAAATAIATAPDDFADRIIAAHQKRLPALADAGPPRHPGRAPIIIAVVAAACVVALAITQLRGLTGAPALDPGPATGSVTAELRTTLLLAGRGRATAERGAGLAWDLGARPPRIDQRAGTIRYDLGPGAPITVATPQGAVDVHAGSVTVTVGAAATTVAVGKGTVRRGGLVVAPGETVTLAAE
jgi:hypothetical protein